MCDDHHARSRSDDNLRDYKPVRVDQQGSGLAKHGASSGGCLAVEALPLGHGGLLHDPLSLGCLKQKVGRRNAPGFLRLVVRAGRIGKEVGRHGVGGRGSRPRVDILAVGLHCGGSCPRGQQRRNGGRRGEPEGEEPAREVRHESTRVCLQSLDDLMGGRPHDQPGRFTMDAAQHMKIYSRGRRGADGIRIAKRT